MSIAAEHISQAALLDMMQMFDRQPWTRLLNVELVSLWSLCNTREQQVLLKDLILKFVVLDSSNEAMVCKQIDAQFKTWGLAPATTRVVAVADAGEVDGSTAGLQKLKNKITPFESWHARFYPSISASIAEISSGDSVVMFDDFVGTGDKIFKKFEWLSRIKEDLGIDFSIYCVSFAGMAFGIENIKNRCGIPVFSSIILSKGISEGMPVADVPRALEVMKEVEFQLGSRYKSKKIRDYSLGYGHSECLYFWMNDNCPNNVFPIFWWPTLRGGGIRQTLLQRAG